jgi:hypothetical protein
MQHTLSFEVDFTTALEYYRRGFEDASELVEDELHESKTLEEARAKVAKILGTLKDRKIEELKAELGL